MLNKRTTKIATAVAATVMSAGLLGAASASASGNPDQGHDDLAGKNTTVAGSVLAEWPEGSTIPVDGTPLIPSDAIPVNVDAAAAVMTPLHRTDAVEAGSTLPSRP